MNAKTSQTKAITDFMLKGGKVTQLMAYNRFGCVNLSGRICEIKKAYKVSKEWIVTKTRKRVIRYST
jgi:hypothetical protein